MDTHLNCIDIIKAYVDAIQMSIHYICLYKEDQKGTETKPEQITKKQNKNTIVGLT